jgi:hypothetical protein
MRQTSGKLFRMAQETFGKKKRYRKSTWHRPVVDTGHGIGPLNIY